MHAHQQKEASDKTDAYTKASYVHFLCFLQDLFFKHADVHLNGSQSQYEAQIIFLMKSHLISLSPKSSYTQK